MRKPLLILPALLLFMSLFSQDSLLKKFKFRNVNYRAITFSVNGSGQYNNADYTAGNNTGHAFGGNLGASWYAIKSTDRILFNASAGFSLSGSTFKAKNTFSPDNNNSFIVNPIFSLLKKWFHKNNFIELGADGSAYISNSKNKWAGAPGTAKNDMHNYSLEVTAGIGKGRLENVTDMQNALWLNDALEKEGSLSRSLSSVELNDLGRAIIVANNTRVLDFRKRTRFILETVDNYFQQRGLISKTDITYFSNLNDIPVVSSPKVQPVKLELT